MELVAIVIGLVVAQYFYLTMKTGMVRGRTGVPAPAMHGNPEFDRQFRVQYNTIEQLVIFFPSVLLFAYYVSEPVAAGLGLVFILGRGLYARGYRIDPAKRGPGFGLTLLANVVLLLGGTAGAVVRYVG
jgi:hypothetical protein